MFFLRCRDWNCTQHWRWECTKVLFHGKMLMSVLFSIPFLLMSNILLAFSAAAAANWDNDFRDLSMMIPRSLSWTLAAKSSCNSPSAHSTGNTTVKTEKTGDEWKEKVGLIQSVAVFLHFLPTITHLSVLGPMPTAARTYWWINTPVSKSQSAAPCPSSSAFFAWSLLAAAPVKQHCQGREPDFYVLSPLFT